MSRSTRSTISPARPRRSTTSTIRCRRPRPACIGAINMLGPGQARRRARSSRPRPARSTAIRRVHPQTEEYWGNVNPIGPARLLRRGQALRRDAVLRLPPPAPAAHQGGAHLQHLWPAHAPERRPRGVELHRPGAAGRGHHHLRRRQQTRSFCYVDDLIEGLVRADGDARTTSPGRSISATRTRSPIRELAEKVIELTGSRSQHRAPAAAAGRSPAAQPDISPRARHARLGAEGRRSTQGLAQTIAYFDRLLAREAPPDDSRRQ